MPHPGSTIPDSGFNEQRVLDELEQLQLAIRATREDRARVEADFNDQLSAFDRPTPPRAAALPEGVPIVALPGIPGAGAEAQPAAAPFHAVPADQPVRRGRRFRPVAGVAAAVAAAALALVWVVNRGPEAAPQLVQQQSTLQRADVAPTAVPRIPVAPADPHAVRIDLTTLRPVWLRVIVDGRIAIEREVGAGEQLPFGADRSIVVRAGDAGAVAVRVGGVDQGPIGRDGQVLNRTFAPAR